MPLFQQSVLKKYLSNLDKGALQSAWSWYQQYFFNLERQNNIRELKKAEYQESFIRELFVTILGYTLNPKLGYNLVIEKKNVTDATKSDAAIVVNGQIRAVIELKDTGTVDLGKITAPAFGYKYKHKNCVYVITGNFEKLRFYINNATDYEEFELFTLSRQRFELLYLCLQQQNLLSNIPLQVKQASLLHKENLTKKLYSDYSLFKRELFKNIVQLNPRHSKLLLFKKTQMLLNRFIFIFFAEDRSLLPPNSVREILAQWQQLKEIDDYYVPLYDRFKKYFDCLDTGNADKEYEIFAYDGCLFKGDEILDNITIDDNILFDVTNTLSAYDFDTDVDADILGHILEHSLAESEELQVQTEGKSFEKNKKKRKKDGIFYTPRYITQYIVENTVGALCTQMKAEFGIIEENFTSQKRNKADNKKLMQRVQQYRNWLLQITICDPACGSGTFLNAALEYLVKEHRTIDELTARIFGDATVYGDIENRILENNLYGVDINEDAVEIAKLNLWLHTAKKGRKLSNLSNKIKCGNSLIDDPDVAGDKAFKWEKQFLQIFVSDGRSFRDLINFLQKWSKEHKPTPLELEEAFNKINPELIIDCERSLGKKFTSLHEFLQEWLQFVIPAIVHDPQRMWLSLFLDLEKRIAIDEVAEENNIPEREVRYIIIKNLLKDIEDNFDEYGDHFLYTTEDENVGFDVVIGNPQYVDIKKLDKKVADFIYRNYETANSRINLFACFIECSKKILSKSGRLSFIVPSSLLTHKSYKALRKLLLSDTNINSIVRLPYGSCGGSGEEVEVDKIILTLQSGKKEDAPVEILIYKGLEPVNEISSLNADSFLSVKEKDWVNDENFVFKIK